MGKTLNQKIREVPLDVKKAIYDSGYQAGIKEAAETIIKKIKQTAIPVAVGKYTNMKFIETSEEELNTIAKQLGVKIEED